MESPRTPSQISDVLELKIPWRLTRPTDVRTGRPGSEAFRAVFVGHVQPTSLAVSKIGQQISVLQVDSSSLSDGPTK
jgi:hypothetical protein